MDRKRSIWLLSEKGILDHDGIPLPNVPFHNECVNAADAHGSMAAVIVNRNQLWTLQRDKWKREVSSDFKLNCVCFVGSGNILVGTENARLAWINNGRLNFIESFDLIDERHLWYTPWGGPPDVRSLAVSNDDTIYANIHVGWIARSKDCGKTWKMLKNHLDIDVHQVFVHPKKPKIVFAATANGFYISNDCGETFSLRWREKPFNYQRACICFAERDIYLTSVSRGPHGQADASLHKSENCGKTWNRVNGLPDKIADNIDTFQIAVVNGGRAFVIVNNSSLYETDNWGEDWHQIGHNYPRLFGLLAF